MEFALTADHHRVHALDAEKGQEYYCPVCGNQVIPRQGEVNSCHFAHVTSCMDDWKYDMSEWHRGWQSRFPENVREIVVEHRGECHRADILMGGYVIEFQHGLQNILLSKWKRFDAFLRDNQPYAPKCSRIKGNPRDWYICPKTHDWHNNQCRECQNNLINEFRTGTDYRQGGLFFYCAYPRIIHEADKYGEVHLPSIRF